MMLRNISTRCFSSSTAAEAGKVAVLGATGGIGQPLSMLLKMEPEVKDLSLYDIVGTPGVAADLSHICTGSTCNGFVGPEQLGDALKGCDVVVIPAGVPRKPGMTRDDLFNTNASIVQTLARGVAEHCPEAQTLIIANPVNSTVPIVAETMRQAGVYDPKRLFGVTTLDVVRAKTFVGQAKGVDPASVDIPVLGGHAGKTILPILSKNTAGLSFTDEEVAALSHRIQFGGDEVVQAKDGAGSATLSMAYAGAHMAMQVLRALNGAEGIIECSFVESNATELPFFSTPVLLGKEGVERVSEIPDGLTEFEQKALAEALPELQASIEKGYAFAKAN